MKICINCIHRHGLNLRRCVECWDKPDRPYWESDGSEDYERRGKDAGEKDTHAGHVE